MVWWKYLAEVFPYSTNKPNLHLSKRRKLNITSKKTSGFVEHWRATDILYTSENFIASSFPCTTNLAFGTSSVIPESFIASANLLLSTIPVLGTFVFNTTFHVLCFSSPTTSALTAFSYYCSLGSYDTITSVRKVFRMKKLRSLSDLKIWKFWETFL